MVGGGGGWRSGSKGVDRKERQARLGKSPGSGVHAVEHNRSRKLFFCFVSYISHVGGSAHLSPPPPPATENTMGRPPMHHIAFGRTLCRAHRHCYNTYRHSHQNAPPDALNATPLHTTLFRRVVPQSGVPAGGGPAAPSLGAAASDARARKPRRRQGHRPAQCRGGPGECFFRFFSFSCSTAREERLAAGAMCFFFFVDPGE